MKPEAPKSSERRIVALSSEAETITTGIAGGSARADRSGRKSRRCRASKVEQDQVDVGRLFQSLVRSSNRAGLVDLCRGPDARHRLPQRVAEQRMVIGNDEMGRRSVHRSLAVVRARPASPGRG